MTDEQYLRNNHLVVKVPSIFIDTVRFKNVDGLVAYKNVRYKPWEHIRSYAEVVSVPRRIDTGIIHGIARHNGKPVYEAQTFHDVNRMLSKKVVYYGPDSFYRTDCYPEQVIKVGDIAYFDYKCLLPPDEEDGESMDWENEHYLNTIKEDGKRYHLYKIPIDQVYLVSRYTPIDKRMKPFDTEMLLEKISENKEEGALLREFVYKDPGKPAIGRKYVGNTYRRKYHAVNGWALVRPDYESWEDIMIKTYYRDKKGDIMKDSSGLAMEKPENEWIVTKPAPGQRSLQGFVEVVGEPMKGDMCQVKAGDHVHLVTNGLLPVRVDSVNYYRTHQTFIMAKTDKPYVPVSDRDYEYIDYSS